MKGLLLVCKTDLLLSKQSICQIILKRYCSVLETTLQSYSQKLVYLLQCLFAKMLQKPEEWGKLSSLVVFFCNKLFLKLLKFLKIVKTISCDKTAFTIQFSSGTFVAKCTVFLLDVVCNNRYTCFYSILCYLFCYYIDLYDFSTFSLLI